MDSFWVDQLVDKASIDAYVLRAVPYPRQGFTSRTIDPMVPSAHCCCFEDSLVMLKTAAFDQRGQPRNNGILKVSQRS